jgi:hypothetical protein
MKNPTTDTRDQHTRIPRPNKRLLTAPCSPAPQGVDLCTALSPNTFALDRRFQYPRPKPPCSTSHIYRNRFSPSASMASAIPCAPFQEPRVIPESRWRLSLAGFVLQNDYIELIGPHTPIRRAYGPIAPLRSWLRFFKSGSPPNQFMTRSVALITPLSRRPPQLGSFCKNSPPCPPPGQLAQL